MPTTTNSEQLVVLQDWMNMTMSSKMNDILMLDWICRWDF